jgi:hypothetical protein
MINKQNIPNREDYSINIDIEKNMSNEKVNELYSVLKKHAVFFYIVNELIVNSKKNIVISILILIISSIFSYILLLLSIATWIQFSTIILISIFLLILFYYNAKNIQTYKGIIKNKKIFLNFPHFPYWDKFKKLKEYKKIGANNVYTNAGLLYKKNYNGLVIYPNFAFEYASMNPKIYAGFDFFNLVSKKDGIVSQYESSKYKYKKFEYKRWMHERKDGGPDRRYKNNQITNFYSYKMLCLKDNCIEVPDHSTYEQLVLDCSTKYTYQEEVKIFETKKVETYEEVKKDKLKLDNLISIENYLTVNGILFNNYGEMIELKWYNKTHLIDKKGRGINTKLSIERILGGQSEHRK